MSAADERGGEAAAAEGEDTRFSDEGKLTTGFGFGRGGGGFNLFRGEKGAGAQKGGDVGGSTMGAC